MKTRNEMAHEYLIRVERIGDSTDVRTAVLLDLVLETLLDIRELLIEQNKK